ncbi:hypothetical protein [Leptodesmis sichuanensis]|uniref:hypothetical protein n=1 Tax=Leptodesmis sichuanensis TaxID=2906798 RepID=UPI001F174671|nr:hypothetical protein [Leptodesmis sichuanensis]UIE39675.1 hypothetical protein KIK02_09010 [Leptodesmis sichuanensis A121]
MADITCCGHPDCNKCFETLDELLRQQQLPPDTPQRLHEALCFACRDCDVNKTPWEMCVLPCIWVDAPGQDPDDITLTSTPTTLSVIVGFTGPGRDVVTCSGLVLHHQWFAESIGTNPEFNFPQQTTPLQCKKYWYVLNYTIPAGTMAEAVYAFSAMITLGNPATKVGFANAYVAGGFVEFVGLN